MLASQPNAPTWRVILSFAAIYFLWGGSFLAIHFALETIPTFMISFSRFATAGVILMLLAWRSGAKRPTFAQWRSATLLGFIMFFGANSTLMIGQRTVPSGLAATLYATLPLWMAILSWLWQGEERPRGRVLVGLVLGFVGVALMFGGGGSGGIDPLGGLLVLSSAICWTVGSLLSRRVDKPESSALASGMNLFSAGIMFLLLSVIVGEPAQLQLDAVSLKSALSVVYLIVGSSVIAFSCYMWLLTVIPPSRVSTYAYMNPVVALFLGTLAGETLNPRELVAALVIVVAIVLITSARSKAVASVAVADSSVRSRLKALAGWGRTP